MPRFHEIFFLGPIAASDTCEGYDKDTYRELRCELWTLFAPESVI